VRRFVSLLVQALSERHVDVKYHAKLSTKPHDVGLVGPMSRRNGNGLKISYVLQEGTVRTVVVVVCLFLLLYVLSCGVGSPNSNGVVELCISCRCSWYSYYSAATCGVKPASGLWYECSCNRTRATEHVIRIIRSENKAVFARSSAGRSCFPKSCERAQTTLLHDDFE
jgi:hypothetical protein